MSKDALGDRMKSYYENRTRIFLPRRTYTLLRIDGKAFHTYTRGLEEPFDQGLMDDMDATAAYLCKNIQGAKLAYVQSDEISILVTDFDKITTDAWFDGNLQKMASVSASMATSEFNRLRLLRAMQQDDAGEYPNVEGFFHFTDIEKFKMAEFDSRVFQIPQKPEVENYFIWRMQDATRNSISAAAQFVCGKKNLHGKNTSVQQDMMMEKGVNWNDYPAGFKRGRVILKETYTKEQTTEGAVAETIVATRTRWVSVEPPVFTKDREFLDSKIPSNSPQDL